MPCILPVSDLRNYNEVLKNVSKDTPVYLTKNGRGCYVVVDIKNTSGWLPNWNCNMPSPRVRTPPKRRAGCLSPTSARNFDKPVRFLTNLSK